MFGRLLFRHNGNASRNVEKNDKERCSKKQFCLASEFTILDIISGFGDMWHTSFWRMGLYVPNLH